MMLFCIYVVVMNVYSLNIISSDEDDRMSIRSSKSTKRYLVYLCTTDSILLIYHLTLSAMSVDDDNDPEWVTTPPRKRYDI